MSEPKRKRYTREFKQDAVSLVTREGYTIAEAARRLDVNENMLGRWKRELAVDGQEAFRGHGVRTQEAEELHRLREENRRLKLERDILKKATAFFASQKP
jgi:transposase